MQFNGQRETYISSLGEYFRETRMFRSNTPVRSPRKETPYRGRKSDSIEESEVSLVSPRPLRDYVPEHELINQVEKEGHCPSCAVPLSKPKGEGYFNACDNPDCLPCGYCKRGVKGPRAMRVILHAHKSASVPWSCPCLVKLGWDVNSVMAMLTYKLGAFTNCAPVSITEVDEFMQKWGRDLKPANRMRLDAVWTTRKKASHRNSIPPDTPSLEHMMNRGFDSLM